MISSAIFSPDRVFRYELRRIWGPSDGRLLLIVGLNPSKADEMVDDPTIRRCVAFAKLWEFDGLIMANLFAFRATDPKEMKLCQNPVGPRNDLWLFNLVDEAETILAAWGADGGHLGRDEDVLDLLGDVRCLGVTKAGMPRHPLYVKGDTPHSPYMKCKL